MKKVISDKVMVLGIDGMDPKITNKMLAENVMPNLKEFIKRGSAREDLVMLGAHPTVTPPMWTTLSTGAYPNTHGITCFFRQSELGLDYMEYNFDSRKCKAEPIWNVLVEAGYKTLVYNWPGSAWPPTSDNENLFVIDGSTPGVPNGAIAKIDSLYFLVASEESTELIFRPKLTTDGNIPCVIDELNQIEEKDLGVMGTLVSTGPVKNIILSEVDGEAGLSQMPYDALISPIKPALNWANAPEDAKEFTILFSNGLIRRPSLILKNEEGIYDRIAVYKNKKELEPLYTIMNGVYTSQLVDVAIKDDKTIFVSRDMRILELAEDGSKLRMYVSDGLETFNNLLWHPKELYNELVNELGYCSPVISACGPNKQYLLDCMLAGWESAGNWQANAIKYLIHEKNVQAVFSHFHNVDCFGHAVWKHIDKKNPDIPLSEVDVQDIIRAVYAQTDRYIAQFMPLLDEGWTIMLVSDHGQICPEYGPMMIGDDTGVNVGVMRELGLTALKKDENGNDLHDIDWENTIAIAVRGNHIYVNLKGRNPYGIVEPEDKYEIEEEIMTRLYGYKHPKTGKRIIAMALRNKDAAILGMGGSECGDIIYWNAEGYNYDHVDSLSTTYGVKDTSVSPIFIAAGKGIKEGYTTTRVIREVDVTPTVATLMGTRMPTECEGAPVYQILEKEI